MPAHENSDIGPVASVSVAFILGWHAHDRDEQSGETEHEDLSVRNTTIQFECAGCGQGRSVCVNGNG